MISHLQVLINADNPTVLDIFFLSKARDLSSDYGSVLYKLELDSKEKTPVLKEAGRMPTRISAVSRFLAMRYIDGVINIIDISYNSSLD